MQAALRQAARARVALELVLAVLAQAVLELEALVQVVQVQAVQELVALERAVLVQVVLELEDQAEAVLEQVRAVLEQVQEAQVQVVLEQVLVALRPAALGRPVDLEQALRRVHRQGHLRQDPRVSPLRVEPRRRP